MTIVELHLDRPALKRVEAGPETDVTTSEQSETESRWSDEDVDAESSGGGIGRKLLLVGLAGLLVFGVMRWRSSDDTTEAAIDIGSEDTRPKTE